VQARRHCVIKESPARAVQKKIYNARLGLLVEDVHKDPLFGRLPRRQL
jgi:hypothetical protein